MPKETSVKKVSWRTTPAKAWTCPNERDGPCHAKYICFSVCFPKKKKVEKKKRVVHEDS